MEQTPNRGSLPAILLRESGRQGKTIGKRTLANITKWPPEKVERLWQDHREAGVGADFWGVMSLHIHNPSHNGELTPSSERNFG